MAVGEKGIAVVSRRSVSESLVKIGTTQAQRRLFFSLARTRREIERLSPGAGLDQQVSNAELVAKKLKVKASEVVDMQQRLEGRDCSLDATVGDGTSTYLESTASDGEPQDEELARAEEQTLIARRIADAMGRLDPRERHIVEARIMGEGKERLRDLGQHFGFSRERARQLEIRALEKLRRDLEPVADEIGWPVSSRTDTDQ